MKFNRAVAVMMAASVVMFQSGGSVFAQSPATPDQMVAALKKNLGESQKRLRQYEWIETTVISLKGEEKSRKQQRVFYGADGKLTKLPIGEPQSQAEQGGRGRRGGRLKEKIVEKKKDEMQDYMERASALIHQYVPPSPDQVQTAKDAGNMKLSPAQQGKVRMEFPNFLLPSDLLSIDVDAAASRLEVVSVASYLDKPEEAVTLDVRFGTLPDGTSYTAQTMLDAKAKNIRVVIENSGHRSLAP